MGLLKVLGLEKPLPEDLLADLRDVQASGQALGLDAARQKTLMATAENAARNLGALQSRIEPGLYALKRHQWAVLTDRLGRYAPGDPAIKTDIAELVLLGAETNVALKDGPRPRAALASARNVFAQAMVARLDSGADLAADLQGYGEALMAVNSATRLQGLMKALDILSASGDARTQAAAIQAARHFARQGQALQAAMRASDAERGAARLPNDVLVHLMTEVNKALVLAPDKADLQGIARDGRRFFMSHDVDRDAVALLIGRARAALTALGDEAGPALCDRLESQLPDAAAPSHRTQQHDNLYGRVFDSKLVHALVKAPAPEMLEASGASAARFADLLVDDVRTGYAAGALRRNAVVADKRSWAAQVPDFALIAAAATDAEALAAVKCFLRKVPASGAEIIGQSYLMVKMAIEQQKEGSPPDFMVEAGKNYQVLMRQVVRERAAHDSFKVMSEGAGITLLHQPPAVEDPALTPSERPTTVNRFGIRSNGMAGDDKDPVAVGSTPVVDMQHARALPFASGVSGSANILLHLFKDLRDKGLAGVGAREFLLNSMLFLVYDGGHSMHEVMWVANQTDTLLGLGLNLGDPDKPNEYVADYDVLAAGYAPGMRAAVEAAMDEAWDGTQRYLEKNSFFATQA